MTPFLSHYHSPTISRAVAAAVATFLAATIPKKLESWVEAAWVKVEAGTEARVPLEATDLK